jgi:hypothetical protein
MVLAAWARPDARQGVGMGLPVASALHHGGQYDGACARKWTSCLYRHVGWSSGQSHAIAVDIERSRPTLCCMVSVQYACYLKA